ncbi:MAG TPA: hemolysin family protein [Bryobacteraceae bacterium]|jgi:CBS domain containing-hemolysin-like protein|nr:hemolysin family protein [Bryobacteraceae bacterium]
MMIALAVATALLIPLLGLVSFVQVLYLESMRLRTRDLPSLKFFKDTLEDRIGVKTEQGAGSFSLIKHTLLIILALIYVVWFGGLWQAGVAAWFTMVAVCFAAPQVLYRRTGGRWLLAAVPLLRAMAWAARPFVALLSFFQTLIELTEDTSRMEEEPTPAENIEALITAGTEEGLIEEEDRELIQSVVEFGDKVVREVMTPRPNIVAIRADATLEELRQLVIHEQYSRIPVFEGNIDQTIGFVHVRDMFEIDEEEREDRLVRELVRTILFVPETKPVNDLMRQMQQENTHMVMVVDEYGNTAGLATMEDLLEVIIGEIRDEHEPSSDVVEDGKGGFIVSGNFDLDRVSDLVESFHREEDIESTTVGGLIGEWLGRVPKPGEWVDRDGIRIDVLASDDMRVEQVRLSKPQTVAHE